MDNQRLNNTIEVIEDPTFSFEGFQVVRGEFFAHTFEPSITFNNYKFAVNTACIKKMPDNDYIQVLVNPETKKLAVRPCSEDIKDSVKWCTPKRSPKQITCRVFFAKVFSLMGWTPHYRYKVIGKLIKAGNELLYVFDLNTPEIYQRTVKDDGSTKNQRTPSYPAHWQDQFGVTVEEHQKNIQVNIFKGYAVFSLNNDTKNKNNTNMIDRIDETSNLTTDKDNSIKNVITDKSATDATAEPIDTNTTSAPGIDVVDSILDDLNNNEEDDTYEQLTFDEQ